MRELAVGDHMIPTASVIIPCYNYGQYLRGCLGSVLSQRGVEVRVLVIDDASQDNSAVVGAAEAQRDGRVELRRHSTNRGHIATYNEGLEWASGDLVVLLSADDLLTPGSLLRAARLLEAHPEVGMVFGRHIDFQTEQPPLGVIADTDECASQILGYHEFLKTSCALGHTPIESPTVVVRGWVHREVGGYRAELPHSCDTEIWLRLASQAAVGVLDADQAFRRWHTGNMTHGYTPLRRYEEQRAAFEVHFRDFADRVGDVAKYRRRLHEGIAGAAFWSAYNAFERGELTTCEEFLRYALSLDRSIRSRPDWARLRWKRLMGPKVFFKLRALVEMLRAG